MAADEVAKANAALWLHVLDEAIKFTDALGQLTVNSALGSLTSCCLCCVREVAYDSQWFDYWLWLELQELTLKYSEQVNDERCLSIDKSTDLSRSSSKVDAPARTATLGETCTLELIQSALRRFRWLSQESMRKVHSDLIGPLVQQHLGQLRRLVGAR